MLVLDFDGVLAPHGALAPLPEVEEFLVKACQHSTNGVYILSNKPMMERIDYFAQHFPSIKFIIAKKKPYPNGLQEITFKAKVKPEELVLVDDRLLTGGLAAILAGTQFLYVRKPFIDYRAKPFKEVCFQCLRLLERLL